MKQHMVWAILSVITFTGHMVAGLYADLMFFLAVYVWFASVACSVLAIYRGARIAGIASAERRTVALASAVIGAIVLLGLVISASTWLFMPQEELVMLAGLG